MRLRGSISRWALLVAVLPVCAFAQSVAPLRYAISTVAGTDEIGDGGPAVLARLRQPFSIAFDPYGALHIIDRGSNRFRRVGRDGRISTTGSAGGAVCCVKLFDRDGTEYEGGLGYIVATSKNGEVRWIVGPRTGNSGDGGPAVDAAVGRVTGLALDRPGNLYLVEQDFHRVRKIDRATGIISAFAGAGRPGFSGDGGPAAQAMLNSPVGIALDDQGNLFIADNGNRRVRRVSSNGVISTVAGTGAFAPVVAGPAALSPLTGANAVAIGSNGEILVATSTTLAAFQPGGNLRIVAGGPAPGFGGDGGPPESAVFNGLSSIAVDSLGAILVADLNNNRIRKITATAVETVVGRSAYEGDGGLAADATLGYPWGLAASLAGDLSIADADNYRIRVVRPDGRIERLAGTGSAANSGDGGNALEAGLSYPNSVAYDRDGALYVAAGRMIRKVTPAGTISRVAGNDQFGDSGDGGPAVDARFTVVAGVAVDSAGAIYISDSQTHRIRKVQGGIITTIAGNGTPGFRGDGGPASQALLSFPNALAVDHEDSLYFSDDGNVRLRKITKAGIITMVAGNGIRGFPQDGSVVSPDVPFPPISGLAFDRARNLVVTSLGVAAPYVVTEAGVVRIPRVSNSPDSSNSPLRVGDSPYAVATGPRGEIFFSDPQRGRVRKLANNTPSTVTITAGDGQRVPANQVAPIPLSVRITGAARVVIPGLSVSFQVTQGTATLSAAAAETSASGDARVSVRMGGTVEDVEIIARTEGLPPVRFQIKAVEGAPIQSPQITSVSSAGGSDPPVTVLAPLSLVRVNGSNLAVNEDPVEAWPVEGVLPAEFHGSCVTAGNEFARIVKISSREIIFVLPPLAPGTVVIKVFSNCGGETPASSNDWEVTVEEASPEFLTYTDPATGKRWLRSTTQIFAPEGTAPRASPALPGRVIGFDATGFGLLEAGDRPPASSSRVRARLRPVVKIGGVVLPEHPTLFAGSVDGPANHLFFWLPTDIQPGEYEVVVTLGGKSSPPGTFVAVAP